MNSDTLEALRAQRAFAERTIEAYDNAIKRGSVGFAIAERQFWAMRAYRLDAQIQRIEKELC